MEQYTNRIPTVQIKTFKTGDHELHGLEGSVLLPAWSGFQQRSQPYNSLDTTKRSDGTVKIIVGEYTASPDLLSVSEEQENAYRYIIEHQDSIRDNLLMALMQEYRQLQREYGYDDTDESMPKLSDTAQFKNLIGLSTVHVLDESKDGTAYVGYEFGCTWDEEHGLGIMTHKERVLEIGGVDTAFDTSIAEMDIDPEQAKKTFEQYKNMRSVLPKKPWWKFW